MSQDFARETGTGKPDLTPLSIDRDCVTETGNGKTKSGGWIVAETLSNWFSHSG
jgi:hypothetical protein